MSSTQSNQPKYGETLAVSTTMFARLASDAFSRAMFIADFGRSIEKIVNAQPVETNVPEVSVLRSNETDAHEGSTASGRASRRAPRTRAHRFLRVMGGL